MVDINLDKAGGFLKDKMGLQVALGGLAVLVGSKVTSFFGMGNDKYGKDGMIQKALQWIGGGVAAIFTVKSAIDGEFTGGKESNSNPQQPQHFGRSGPGDNDISAATLGQFSPPHLSDPNFSKSPLDR